MLEFSNQADLFINTRLAESTSSNFHTSRISISLRHIQATSSSSVSFFSADVLD